MKYTKLKCINQYKNKSINPAKTPDTVFEMYSVPIYETGHPEYLRGNEIASNKVIVEKMTFYFVRLIRELIEFGWWLMNQINKTLLHLNGL